MDLIFLCFALEVFACGTPVTGGALIGRFAEAHFGSEVFAVAGGANGVDGIAGHDIGSALDVLRGNLEAVEKERGTARVKVGGAEGVEDLGEGKLDGAAVFTDG